MRSSAASRDVLAAALREIGAALAPRRLAGAAAVSDDPLRLALPPVPPTSSWSPAGEVLDAFAALYLHAELEEAGVIPVVEALTERRHAFSLRERSTADRLERFARSARDFPSRDERAVIYARLFGLGPSPIVVLTRSLADSPAWGGEGPGATRVDFRQRLARFTTAVVRAEGDRARLGTPSVISQASWRVAAQQLLALVAAEPAGTLVHWARRIHARSLTAFEILGDAGLMRQVVSRTPWETLQRLLSPDDAHRRDTAARRGAAGQALLRSLTTAVDESRPDAMPDAATVQAAVRWLIAMHLPVPQASYGPPVEVTPIAIPRTAFAATGAERERSGQPIAAEPIDALAEDALPENTWAAVP